MIYRRWLSAHGNEQNRMAQNMADNTVRAFLCLPKDSDGWMTRFSRDWLRPQPRAVSEQLLPGPPPMGYEETLPGFVLAEPSYTTDILP